MKKLKILSLLLSLGLLLCGICWGANVIVDGSGGGDYTTIDSAVEGASDNDTVLIKDTTGGNCTNGVWVENPYIGSGNTETLLIKPHPDNTYPIRIKPSVANQYPFRLYAEDNTGKYTFEDIIFDATDSNNFCFFHDGTKDVTFNQCEFVLGTSTPEVFYRRSYDSNPETCDLVVNNCSATAVSTTNKDILTIREGTVTFIGGTYDWALSATSGSGIIFYIIGSTDDLLSVTLQDMTLIARKTGIITNLASGTLPVLNISGNTITGGAEALYLIYFQDSTYGFTDLICNNNILTSDNHTVCYSIYIASKTERKITLNGNTITNCRSGIYFIDGPEVLPKYLEVCDNYIVVPDGASKPPFTVGGMCNYSHSGTATGGGNDYILLACDVSLGDDYWNDAYIKIESGTGVGQIARVIDYDAIDNPNGSRYAQVDAVWAIDPCNTSVYSIWFEDICREAIFKNNVFINNLTGSAASSAKTMAVYGGIKTAIITGNYVRTTNNERGITLRCTNAIVKNNVSYGKTPFYWQGKGHCDVINNTFVSTNYGGLTWRMPSNLTDNMPTGTMTAYNNILGAIGANTYCIFDYVACHNQQRFDYNCYYYTDYGRAARMDGDECRTLADLQDAWANPSPTWGADVFVWTDNDSNSFAADPLFVDAGGGDFDLLPNSPCIGASDNGGVIGAGLITPAIQGDLNSDKKVDFVDFAIFAGQWLEGI